MSKKEKIIFDSEELPVAKEGVSLLEVKDLKVTFPSEDGSVYAVRGVDLKVESGEIVGIVGESGSGKSVTSMAIMGLLDESAKVEGSIKLHGVELANRPDGWMSKVRGLRLSMIFQDPLSALTPVYTVGDQIVEALEIHGKFSKEKAKDRALELLELVGIPNPEIRFRAFPHEFSGGMRQRAMIAMAIANNPDLIIADEPTTALDVTIQAQILDVLRTAQKETGAGVIMITHDLGVVAGIADRVNVMYAGRFIEKGDVDDIFYRSRMPYTIGLLGSVPRPDEKTDEPLAQLEGNPPSMLRYPTSCPFAPRCPLKTKACLEAEPPLLKLTDRPDDNPKNPHLAACIRANEIAEKQISFLDIYAADGVNRQVHGRKDRTGRKVVLEVDKLVKTFPLMKGSVFKRRVGTVHAVDGVSFDIRSGETLGLVGESGCGKTTTLLSILDLVKPEAGSVVVLGSNTAEMNRTDRKRIRQDLQVVFQDPMASLDPRMPVSEILAEPLKYNGWDKTKIKDRIKYLMDLVGLEPAHLNRYPRNFSGGQKQRIGIARALALEPQLLILDEPVSALDVSIQAGVINLLDRLRSELDLSYLFVAHDLSVIRHIADRVAVMYLGKIVEVGDVNSVYDKPQHPYTQALLSAIPIPDPNKEKARKRILLEGDLPSPANPPQGCRFSTRCRLLKTLSDEDQELCLSKHPDQVSVGCDHLVACNFPKELSVF